MVMRPIAIELEEVSVRDTITQIGAEPRQTRSDFVTPPHQREVTGGRRQ